MISIVKRQIGFEVRWTLAASLSRATLFLVNLSLNMLLNKTSCLVGVTKELGLIIQALGVQGPWGLQVYIVSKQNLKISMVLVKIFSIL